ncbi:MAG: molybdopterin synthase catalytic subunit [Paraglaciecola sp.]|jgi:hypothetical protein
MYLITIFNHYIETRTENVTDKVLALIATKIEDWWGVSGADVYHRVIDQVISFSLFSILYASSDLS